MFLSTLLFLLLVAKCLGDCLPTTPTIAESLEEELGDGILIARLAFTQTEVVKEEEEISPTEELTIVGDNGEPEDVFPFPLTKCQGDCDDDDECEGRLQCFNRDDLEEVIGCIGDGESGRDYCYIPPDLEEEEEPTTQMISTNPCSFEVYQGGGYIFTNNVQAFTIEEIFHDGSSNVKVGDEIPLLYSTDTGYRKFFLASPLNVKEDGFLAVVKLVSSCYINEQLEYPYPIQEAIIQPYEMNECNFNLNIPWSSVTEEEQVLLRAIDEDTDDEEVVCSPLSSVFQGQALQSKFMNTTMSPNGDIATWKDADMYINGEGDEVVGTQSGNCTLQQDVNDGEWECTIELILPRRYYICRSILF